MCLSKSNNKFILIFFLIYYIKKIFLKKFHPIIIFFLFNILNIEKI